MESAGKGEAIEKNRAVIGGKNINEKASFLCNLRAVHKFFLWQSLDKILIKLTLKADKWYENGKSFTKKLDFLLYFFNN